mgnify:CR=1 FL=1
MPTIVTKQASENPILFYKHFLENTVLGHPELFAHLTAWGETIAGIGLTLGLMTGVASLVAVLAIGDGVAVVFLVNESDPLPELVVGLDERRPHQYAAAQTRDRDR